MTASPIMEKGGSDQFYYAKGIATLECLLDAKVHKVLDRMKLELYMPSPIMKICYYDSKNDWGFHSIISYRKILEDCRIQNISQVLIFCNREYMMWYIYDVHFYAYFALLDLFPKIEFNIQREFAKAMLIEVNTKVKFLAEGNWRIRKVKGAVPHDLGLLDPWLEINAYKIHDTGQWKDLTSKFILQVYRDLVETNDMSFGKDVQLVVCAAMEYMQKIDLDGDGLIEDDGFSNDRFFDRFYDTQSVHGASAYCGSSVSDSINECKECMKKVNKSIFDLVLYQLRNPNCQVMREM